MSLRLLTRYGLPRDITPPPAAFSPDDIADLRLWLDAADASTITASGGAVSKWTSKDANAREFTQSSGSLQPTTGASTLNSLNVVDFASDYLVGTSAESVWEFLHDGTKHTVFLVWKPGAVANPNARYTVYSTGAVAGDSGAYLAYDDRSTASRNDVLQHVINNTLSNRAVINTSANDAATANAYQIVRVTSDPSNATAASRSSIFVNAGSAIANNTQTGTPSSGNPNFTLHVGAVATASPSDQMTGGLAEMLMYERDMSAQEVEDVEDYLAAKWGITLP